MSSLNEISTDELGNRGARVRGVITAHPHPFQQVYGDGFSSTPDICFMADVYNYQYRLSWEFRDKAMLGWGPLSDGFHISELNK